MALPVYLAPGPAQRARAHVQGAGLNCYVLAETREFPKTGKMKRLRGKFTARIFNCKTVNGKEGNQRNYVQEEILN